MTWTSEYGRQYYLKNKEKLKVLNNKYKLDNQARVLWTSAKERALKFDIPFTIEISDIVIPEFCPILNIPMFKGKGKPCANSPSLDRIIPSSGYTKDNIMVISYKANTMKSDATPEELLRFSKWILESFDDYRPIQ